MKLALDTFKMNKTPLCVDLDGTLIKTDVTFESMIAFIFHMPWRVFSILIWLFKGRAHLKKKLAEATHLRAEFFPYHEDFLAFLKTQKAAGRPLILVTAADETIAQNVADHLGIFDEVIASDGQTNQRAHQKAQTLVDKYGEGGFVYAGNSRDDLAVWARSKSAIAVHTPASVLKKLRASGKAFEEYPRVSSLWGAFFLLIRPHQWSKNLLVFLPLLASHQFLDVQLVSRTLLGFFSFSLVASSIYIFNDLMDMESDRQHPRKKYRSLAQASFPIPWAIAAMAFLIIAGFGLSLHISPIFSLVLSGYLGLTTAYSLRLKRLVLIDVLTLSFLYTLRVVGGYAATELAYSNWLLMFSGFLFLSLGFMKRFTELKSGPQEGILPGRGYVHEDTSQIARFGTGAGYLAVLVLALYIDSDVVKALYGHPQVLWALCPGVVYFISNLWLVAGRGKMHDDPVVFALKSKKTYLIFIYSVIVAGFAVLA